MPKTATYVFVGDAASLVKAARETQAAMDATAKSSEASATKIGSSQKKATEQTEGFHLRIRKSFAGVAASAVKGSLEIAGAYASIEGARKAIDATEELAETTVKLSKNFGLATKFASEFAGVASSRDMDPASLTMGFKTLSTSVRNATEGIGGQSKALTDLQAKDALKFKQDQALGASAVSLLKTRQGQIAAEGALAGKTSAQIKIFQELGISQQDLVKHGNDLEWVLNKVADGMAKLPSGTDKAAISAKLFGRNSQEMSLLVGQGSAAMNKQLDAAGKLGDSFDGKGIRSAEGFIEAQRHLKEAVSGAEVTIGKALIPTLTKGIDKVDGFALGMRDGTGAGGQFAHAMIEVDHDLKPVIHAAGDITTFLEDHPKLITTAIGSWAAYKTAVGLATAGTKLKLAAAFFGLAPKAAEGGAEAGAAFGEAAGAAAGRSMTGLGLMLSKKIGPIALTFAVVEGARSAITGKIPSEVPLIGGHKLTDNVTDIISGYKAPTVSAKGTSSALAGLANNLKTKSQGITYSGSYKNQAFQAASKYGIDPAVFLAQINQESGFQTNRTSSAGAIGIAQIMPGTAKGWGVNPHNPTASLDAAAKNMAKYIQMYGVEGALRAYNSGTPTGHSSETNKYVASIMGAAGAGSPSMGGGGTPDIGALEQAAQGELAQTAAQKAAAAAKKAKAAKHAALVKAHNEQIKAASRAVNAIAKKYGGMTGYVGSGSWGQPQNTSISSLLKSARTMGTVVDDADAQYGRDQRTGDLNVQAAGGDTTAAGYAARKSELAMLTAEQNKQLDRQKQELAKYQAADKKYSQIIKSIANMLSVKGSDGIHFKLRGPARAKVQARKKAYQDSQTDVRAHITALNGSIQDTQSEIEDLSIQDTQANVDYAGAVSDAAQSTVDKALSDIDAHVRAGDMTQAQGDQAKIDTINAVLANPQNGLNADQTLAERGNLADTIKDLASVVQDNTTAVQGNTTAADDLKAATAQQTANALAVTSTELAVVQRSLVDMFNGQLGARAGVRALMPGSGQISRL